MIYLYDKIWLQCTRDLIHTLKGKLYKLFNSSVLLGNQEKRDTKVENLYITNKSTLINQLLIGTANRCDLNGNILVQS